MKKLLLLGAAVSLVTTAACNRSGSDNYEGRNSTTPTTTGMTEDQNQRDQDLNRTNNTTNTNQQTQKPRAQTQTTDKGQVSRGGNPDNPLEETWETIKDPDHDKVTDDGDLTNKTKNTTEDTAVEH